MDVDKLLHLLLGATAIWADCGSLDERAVALRHAVILRNHHRYVDCIPVYRELAQQRGLVDEATVEDISNELMFTTELFKSYDVRWLDEANYGRLTEWLGSIFITRPVLGLSAVSSIDTWRRRLAEQSIFLTYSSGTSGKLSFVPRDPPTLKALSRNGWYYSHAIAPMRVMEDSFDCLVLGPRGTGMGIQAAATGLGRAAARSHFLLDFELDADLIRSALPRQVDGEQTQHRATTEESSRDDSYADALRFLSGSVAESRPVVVFGTPIELTIACSWMDHERRNVRLPGGSVVITGGGWKSAWMDRITQEQLSEQVKRSLGVPTDHIIDTYSTAECNFFCMRCRAGRYHVPPLVEVVMLDETLSVIQEDDAYGLIGFLDPFAACYPGFLITGDEGRVVSGRCPCGLSGPSIIGEIRRASDFHPKGCAGVIDSFPV